jgi:hypothetical protein
MSTPPLPPGGTPASPGLVIRPGAGVPRHALGLPAGSVRALLTFMILGLIWALMLLPEEKEIKIPLYLYYLMFLILGHFFAAHGHSIASPATGTASPLYLPRGTLRTLIIVGFLAVLGYRYYLHRNIEDLLNVREPLLQQPYLPLVILTGFFVGVFLGRLFGRKLSTAPWFQDILAWVALLATLGLGAEVIILLIINPSVAAENRLYLEKWHVVLSGIISFYFGARS